MKKVFAVFAVAAFATTAAAQGGGGMKGMAGMDQQKAVTQEGPTPAGWSIRPDKPANPTTSVNFVAMGPGMHVTSGETAAIYWNPANTASGTYTVSATFGVRSIPLHDAIGLIWGGNDLSGDKESYGYFLVYGNGTFAVKHRSGSMSAGTSKNTDVHTVVAQTANAAIKAAPADGGSTSNKLAVKLGADSVRFFVNDTQVAAVDAKNPMMPTSGVYGFRVNHGISVHVSDLKKD
ncbi:MAG TPA: hypothetical protein VGI97_07025 [Gemmatimonadaceae bacterium]|jgi:hypothetical protein